MILTLLKSDRAKRVRQGFLCGALGFTFAGAVAVWQPPKPVVLIDPKPDELVMLNGCVVSACNYLANVRAMNQLNDAFWSRILLVRYKEQSAGHAYCVWKTDGQVFGYDRAGGSFPIPGGNTDPVTIATALAGELTRVMKRPMLVERAEFIEPATASLTAY